MLSTKRVIKISTIDKLVLFFCLISSNISLITALGILGIFLLVSDSDSRYIFQDILNGKLVVNNLSKEVIIGVRI